VTTNDFPSIDFGSGASGSTDMADMTNWANAVVDGDLNARGYSVTNIDHITIQTNSTLPSATDSVLDVSAVSNMVFFRLGGNTIVLEIGD